MKITFLGHASFHIEINGYSIIVDPFITANPKASSTSIDNLVPQYILLTHAHGDHVADVESISSKHDSLIISNYEIVSYYQNKGFKGHPLNHGGKKEFDFGICKYVNAIHTSTFPDGSNGGDPGGFVIWNDEKCIYIAGDTALTMDMKLIPLTCPKLDCAILPVGDNFTMGYEDAAIASEFIQCDKIIACHFDTFPFIEIDKGELRKAFANKELIIPDIDQTIEI